MRRTTPLHSTQVWLFPYVGTIGVDLTFATHVGRRFLKRMSNPKLHESPTFASGPSIPTSANVPVSMGCKCYNRATSSRQWLPRLRANAVTSHDGSSMVRSALGWKTEVKICAARQIIGGPQMAPMLFNNGAANGQADADTPRLRGEERIEYLIHR
jgi:hypothetical protein